MFLLPSIYFHRFSSIPFHLFSCYFPLIFIVNSYSFDPWQEWSLPWASCLGQVWGVLGRGQGHTAADRPFPHDLECSVGIRVALAFPQPAETAVGSSPSGVLFLLPPELSSAQSLLLLAAFSCIPRFEFLLIPRFSWKWTSHFCFFVLIAWGQVLEKERETMALLPYCQAHWLYGNTECSRVLWMAVRCHEIIVSWSRKWCNQRMVHWVSLRQER